MSNLFEECRENFGAPPRGLGVWNRVYFFPQSPQWLASDPLQRVAQDRGKLLKSGRVVPASLVQANMKLFAPGTHDLPALAVWSEDPEWEAEPVKAREWGHRVFDLKGEKPEGDLEKLAGLVTNERARPLNYRIPESFTGGKTLYLSTLLVYRRHLPFGYLTSGVLPLVVLPEVTPAAIILPGRYWPQGLKDR